MIARGSCARETAPVQTRHSRVLPSFVRASRASKRCPLRGTSFGGDGFPPFRQRTLCQLRKGLRHPVRVGHEVNELECDAKLVGFGCSQ
jgi:hypothetical protein